MPNTHDVLKNLIGAVEDCKRRHKAANNHLVTALITEAATRIDTETKESIKHHLGGAKRVMDSSFSFVVEDIDNRIAELEK